MLPHRDQDPVLRLYSHYFQAAEVMREQRRRLQTEVKKSGHLSRRNGIDLYIYSNFWLSALFVVIEGVRDLELDQLIKCRPPSFHHIEQLYRELADTVIKHETELRYLRNATFHFQKTPEK